MDTPSEMDPERWQATLGYMTHLLRCVPYQWWFADMKQLANHRRAATSPCHRGTHVRHGRDGEQHRSVVVLPADVASSQRSDRSPRCALLVRRHRQFMSRGTDVVALLDFEIANVGDTHWDLACFEVVTTRTWATSSLYREYERVTELIDRRVVGYYTVAFLQLAVIGATFFMMIRGGNWIEGAMKAVSPGGP